MASFREVINELGLRKDTEGQDRIDYFCPQCDNESGDLSYYKSSHSNGEHFACHGEGGSKPISLLMHCKGWNNTEKAVEWFKSHFPEENHEDDQEDIDRKKKARQVLDKAAVISQDTLFKQRKDLLEDIKDRREFEEEHIKEAGIGFFSRDDAETLKKRFDKQALVDSGLFIETDEGNVFSHLQNRIVFPYQRDDSTKFMAGRALPGSEDQDKYKKAVQTDYNKHILYEFTDSERDAVIITEGFTDTISAWIAGYNVISPATVKFRSQDIEKIQRAVKSYSTVYLVNDGDERGQEGAEDTAKALLEEEIDPEMVQLNEDEDLDDWTTENGYEIKELLAESSHFLDLKIEEANEASRRNQSKKCKQVLELVQTWDELDIEWILDQLPIRKSTLEKKFSRIQEENNEPNEPDEPNEPQRTKDMRSEGGLLHQLQEEKERESIRMSGITDKGTKLSTTFMKLKGVTKPIVFAEGQEAKDLLEVSHKLDEFDEEELENMSNDQRQKNDYHYVRLDGKEIILDPRPLKIEHDMKTPDSGLLDYFQGEKEVDQDIYTQVRDYVENHWYHFNEEWYDVLAAWIIHTYLLQDLPVTPYIFLTGVKDTGKTQAQRVINQIAYHSVRNEQPTPASMERQVSYSHSTVHLDEMDKLSEEEATRITRTVNSGYNHGATRTLVNTNVQDIERQNQTLHTYSAKTIAANGLHKYSDTVKSRGFIIDSTPKPEDVEIEDIRRPSERKKQFLSDLRNQLFWLSINQRNELLEKIDNARNTLDVENRQEDKLSIVFGIIDHFKDKKYAAEVCEFLLDQSVMKGKDLSQNDEAFLKVVASNTDEDGLYMKLSDIASRINEETGRDDDSKFRVSSSKVGEKLRKYGLVQDAEEHKPRKSDGYYATIPREIVLKQFKSHGFEELASTIQGSSSLSDLNSVRSGSSGSSGSFGSSDNNQQDVEFDRPVQEVKETLRDHGAAGQGGSTVSFPDLLSFTDLDEDKLHETVDELIEAGDLSEDEAGEFRVVA